MQSVFNNNNDLNFLNFLNGWKKTEGEMAASLLQPVHAASFPLRV